MVPRLAVLLLLLAPAASADTVELTFEARESDCPGDRTYCFAVEGDLGEVAPADTLRLTFRNAGDIEHDLHVALLEDANVGEDTFASSAFFQIDAIGPGAETFANLTVPADAGGLYFWCDIAGHEQLGMWTEQDFGGDDNGAPMVLWPAVVALAVAGLLARR